MQTPILVAALALVIILPVHAHAQADTAVHRQVYDAVNKAAGSMKKAKATARAPGVEYSSELTAWSDSTGVRKIAAVAHDDSGDVEHEFYYQDGALLFVYHAIKGFEGKKQVTRVEHRYYFRDGSLFKWLGGSEKAPTPPTDPEFASTGTELLAASEAFVKAVQSTKSAAKPASKPATQTAVGKFTGIEQGDYAHLQIQYPDGTDDSFFVLNDEGGLKGFLDKPDTYKGKTIEVSWQEREENIPEAGGPQMIRVAVSARVKP